MPKHEGNVLMDDTSLGEQAALHESIKARCVEDHGPGVFTSSTSVDNPRLLNWSYVTEDGEASAPETGDEEQEEQEGDEG